MQYVEQNWYFNPRNDSAQYRGRAARKGQKKKQQEEGKKNGEISIRGLGSRDIRARGPGNIIKIYQQSGMGFYDSP